MDSKSELTTVLIPSFLDTTRNGLKALRARKPLTNPAESAPF
jgi:hypothetical protein